MGNSVSVDPSHKRKLVIVGGGVAGVALAREMDALNEYFVILIERKEYYFHNIAALRAVVQKGYSEEICIPYDNLLTNGIVVRGDVTSIHANSVHVNGYADPIPFDELVICTGTSYAFPAKVPHVRAEKTHELYRQVNRLVDSAKDIVIVGGGSVGVELAGELAVDYRGKLSVTLVHSGSSLMPPTYSDAFRAKLAGQLTAAGVRLVFNDRVQLKEWSTWDGSDNPDAPQPLSYAAGERTVTTEKGVNLRTDLVFYCGGSQVNSNAYRTFFANHMNESGRLKVNEYFQVANHSNIYAIGDCADVEEQRALYAMKHAQHLAKNLKRRLQNKQAKKYVVDGKPLMLVTVGRTGGAGQIGTSLFGPRFSRMLKSEGMMTEKSWKTLRALYIPSTKTEEKAVRAHKEKRQKQQLQRREKLEDKKEIVQAVLRLAKDERGNDALRLLLQGFPAAQVQPGAQHV